MSSPTGQTVVEVFADGACSGNPGPGGWGAILRAGTKERELSGCETATTNNRMELMAAIVPLETLTRPCRVSLTTDSKYVVQGMSEWIIVWQKNGWKTASKKEVLNRDLWERLLAAASQHRVQWHWIRGHAGHPENERCDRLARSALRTCGKGA